jgi:DNA-binding transcriptional MerR regulator
MRGDIGSSDDGKRSEGMPDLVVGIDPKTAGPRTSNATFHIRDLTREFKVTARTLRFYEERGLISPRRDGQERVYSRRDRARLMLVLMGKSVGFSLDGIRAMLDLYDTGDGQTTQLKVALSRFREQIEKLKVQRHNIDKAIAELQRASELVAAKLASL